MQGQQMKIVYVDPSNPLPDRQYYGRVQLVEVRNGNEWASIFFPVVHLQVIYNQIPNTY